jgi:hypothetical protein
MIVSIVLVYTSYILGFTTFDDMMSLDTQADMNLKVVCVVV